MTIPKRRTIFLCGFSKFLLNNLREYVGPKSGPVFRTVFSNSEKPPKMFRGVLPAFRTCFHVSGHFRQQKQKGGAIRATQCRSVLGKDGGGHHFGLLHCSDADLFIETLSRGQLCLVTRVLPTLLTTMCSLFERLFFFCSSLKPKDSYSHQKIGN